MKPMTRLFTAFAALALTFGTVAAARPNPQSKPFQIRGRVLQIDEKARTLLVADHWTQKLYLVTIPEGGHFKITFGRNMALSYPEISDVSRKEQVAMRVRLTSDENLTQLQDGREAVGVIASR